MRQFFETDGIRGRANEYPMTPELAMRLGQALAIHFSKEQVAPRMIIGKDPRRSSYVFEFAVASGACSMGASVFLLGPLPTPAVAALTVSMRAAAGVMISASHNPFYDNGIKLFGADGFKLPDAVEEEIEAMMKDETRLARRPTGPDIGRAYRIEDASGRYIGFAKDTFPHHLSLRGMKIILDCANGAAFRVAPAIFEELGASVVKLGCYPDGVNINEGCGALHPQELAEVVKREKAHIGIALDGDADRVIMVDELGEVADGDAIMAVVGRSLLESGKLKSNTVVATIMSNLGLDLEMERVGGKVVRAPVGDRYVIEVMRAGGYNFGGEQSGHLILLDQTTTGDGIVAALQVMAVMVEKGKTLSELVGRMERFPQVSAKVPVRRKVPIEELPELRNVVRMADEKLGREGRTVVRYSGTEPVLRIMVEARDGQLAQTLVDDIRDTARRLLGD